MQGCLNALPIDRFRMRAAHAAPGSFLSVWGLSTSSVAELPSRPSYRDLSGSASYMYVCVFFPLSYFLSFILLLLSCLLPENVPVA